MIYIFCGGDMQINFTGIKNIGYENSSINYVDKKFSPDAKAILGVGDSTIKTECHWLNIQLTDDYNGKHLSGYKKAMQDSGLSTKDYRNPINGNFLNFLVSEEVYDDLGVVVAEDEFYINDQKVYLSDETLPIFSYISKLIREISKKPEKDFIVNRDYLTSEDASKGIVIGNDLQKHYAGDYDNEIKRIHNPRKIKVGAEIMDKIVMNEVGSYFNVNV